MGSPYRPLAGRGLRAWALGAATATLGLLGALLLSCAPTTAPEGSVAPPEVRYPEGRTILRPTPPRYRTLYHEVAACVGLPPSYHLVTWFSAPRILYLVPLEDGRVARLGLKGVQLGYQITLRWDHLSDDDVVRHESLHQLLVTNLGADGHPTPPFGTCAPLGASVPDPPLPGWGDR